MQQYRIFELIFRDPSLKEMDACLPLRAVFTREGKQIQVKGFYDGEGIYKIRFLPLQPGLYRWEVSGLFSARGEEICLPAEEGDHGPVRAQETHFVYADGHPYIPFGTTVYALAHQEDALVEKTLESLKKAPFNKIRLCLFPKDYTYNHNEPPFYAFEKKEDGAWDVTKPCLSFWQRFERILGRIYAMGIETDLILFHPYDRWGFASLSMQENLVYLDYVLRRLSAFPGIWWSLANEYDLCEDHKSLSDWEEIEAFVKGNDPFGHLLSCHNCFCFWDASRKNISHASLQTKGLAEIPRWIEKYKKPVVIDECCYEGDLPDFWGSISGREMVRRFWRCFASGAFCTHGETFLSEDEILWWAKGGKLKGQSPSRIAFLREIMESLPGPLTPKRDGVLTLAQKKGRELEEALLLLPEDLRPFVRTIAGSMARMEENDRTAHLAGEHEWASHAGEDAFLWYNDLQCFGRMNLDLPEDHSYRVEYIDTWEMTRTPLKENACGKTVIELPGREDLAVLALRTDH